MGTNEIGGWIGQIGQMGPIGWTAQSLVQYFVNSLWQLPLLAAAGWLVSRMVRRLGPGIQHRVWAATLLLSALTPLGGLRHGTAGTEVLLVAASTYPAGAQPPPGGLGGRLLHLTPALYWAVALGYFVFLLWAGIRLAVSYGKARNLGRNSTVPALSNQAEELWQQCRRVFAVGGATLRCSSRITGPATIGYRKPRLLLPAGFLKKSSPEDLVAALAHECAHLERHDFLLNLLYQIAALPVAFHPAVWLAKQRIAETRELICDRMAAERLTGARAYAHSLLRLAETMSGRPGAVPPYAIGMFDANTLENRIMHLTRISSSVSARRKLALRLLAISLLSASGVAALALTINVEPAGGAQMAAAAGSTAAKIYKVGEDGAGHPCTASTPHCVTAPTLVYAPDPEFPKSAKQDGGVCIVGLIVDTQGHPQQVHVVRSLGLDFDREAVRTVQRYKFKPAMRDGKPVAVSVNIEVNFRRD
jgi:TonB family protein